jgi:hypothetical protein
MPQDATRGIKKRKRPNRCRCRWSFACRRRRRRRRAMIRSAYQQDALYTFMVCQSTRCWLLLLLLLLLLLGPTTDFWLLLQTSSLPPNLLVRLKLKRTRSAKLTLPSSTVQYPSLPSTRPPNLNSKAALVLLHLWSRPPRPLQQRAFIHHPQPT